MWTFTGKITRGKLRIILTVMGVLFIGGLLSRKLNNVQNNSLIKMIEKDYLKEHILNETILNDALQKIAQKQEEKKVLDANEYFILGYKDYREGNIGSAIENFEHSNVRLTRGTNGIIRLYNGIFLTELFLSEERYEEAIRSTKSALEQMSMGMFKSRYNEVIRLLNTIIYVPGGREVSIDILEDVLQKDNQLSIEQVCDIKNKIAVLYLYNGNYAKGFERCLEVIAMQDKVINQYYVAKAYVDMGALYGALGDKEYSRQAIEKALEIEIEDEQLNALSKTYALVNLYSSLAEEGNLEKLIESSKKVESYISLLDQDALQSIQIISNAILTYHYAEIGEIESAEKFFKKANEAYKQIKNKTFVDVDVFYNEALGHMLAIRGDLEGSVKKYEEVLQISMANGNPGTAKVVLTILINMLNEMGQYEKANVYEQQRLELLEREAVLVNRDYAEYALYKYEFEKKQVEMSAEKMKRYIIAFIGILIICIGLVITYMKYTTLKKLHKLDGLTKAYNRYYFEEQYKQIVESTRPFAVIMLDIDNFKSINDRRGHVFGDYVIKTVVGIGQSILGQQGDLFRYGGEEFVILLEGKTKAEVIEIAEEIRKCVATYMWDKEINITISLGVVETTDDLRDILEEADKKLYLSKTSGKNKVTY